MTTTTDASTASPGPLDVRCEGPVRRLVLCSPQTRNALGADMVAALDEAVGAAASDPQVRVIVFEAQGEVFSAGGNLGSVRDRLAAPPGPDGRDPIAVGNRRYGRVLERLADCPKVTIVAVQGAAMGGGAGLVCAADLGVGLRTAKFGFPETSIGLIPGQILPFVAARIGLQAARRLMLTGERIDGAEALRLGLLDHVAEDRAELSRRLEALVDAVLGTAPAASAATKASLRRVAAGALSDPGAREAYLDDASVTFANQMRTEGAEGIEAARNRVRPAWAVRGSR